MGTGGHFPGGIARPWRNADPQAPPWHVVGLLYFTLLLTLEFVKNMCFKIWKYLGLTAKKIRAEEKIKQKLISKENKEEKNILSETNKERNAKKTKETHTD
jgi:hypothetical protein